MSSDRLKESVPKLVLNLSSRLLQKDKDSNGKSTVDT